MKKLLFLPVLMMTLMLSYSFASNKPGDEEVQKAFELRMKGKVDEAKALLESILSKDSTNAMAYYEMARLEHYMFIGGGPTQIGDVMATIAKAVSYAPDNVTYTYYKAIASFLNAFMAMETGQGEVKNRITQTCSDFGKVLSLKPDYPEAMLYLVEIYGLLPAEMGGDSLKAWAYAAKLEKMNAFFGAKARASLAPDSMNRVLYWEDLAATHGSKPEYLAEAGKACLFSAELAKAEQYFNEAMKADPTENILVLDLARYHIMQVMQNKDEAKTELPLAKIYLERYLETRPEPLLPLKAYTLGLLSMCDNFLGNKEASDKHLEEAKSLDKYFSRAYGIPTLFLFDPPGEICHHYFSFFSPF